MKTKKELEPEMVGNFRNNLKLLRLCKNLTGKELSQALGWEKLYRVADLEDGARGNPKMKEMFEVADFFQVSIDDLLRKKGKLEIVFKEPDEIKPLGAI